VSDEVSSDEETSITVPDVYETYINSLAPGERPIPLNVVQESHTLQSIMMVIDNREEVEGIIDPGPCPKQFATTSAWNMTRL
jgi:hypothetical protein